MSLSRLSREEAPTFCVYLMAPPCALSYKMMFVEDCRKICVYVVGARDATHSGAHITLHTDYIHIVFAHKMCIVIKMSVHDALLGAGIFGVVHRGIRALFEILSI